MAVWSLSSLKEVQSTRRVDSEFFRPEYSSAEQRVRSCDVQELGRLGAFVPGPFGSAFHVQNYDVKSPYRYIRGKDVKPFFLLNDDNRFIPAADFARLRQYEVRNDDLMISVVGTLGNVAICTEEDVPAMFSCKSTLFRSNEADPYFLLAFLNSRPGSLCMLRRQRGAIQMGLNMEDLRSIPIPRFEKLVEQEIAGKVRASHNSLIIARQKYETARQLLESELGLDKLKFKKPVSYLTQLKVVEMSRRFDPEHYFPAFSAFCAGLPSNVILAALSQHLQFCQRGKQPTYGKVGLPVVNSKHVQANRVVMERTRTSLANPIHDLQIRSGDTLLNGTGRGTIGRAAPYLGSAPAVADNHVTILRSSSLDPAYLSMYLNSTAGQMQVEMHQRGTSGQLELYPFDIRKFLVWPAPALLQRELRDLYDTATGAEQESRRLLTNAKTLVEQLIGEAIGHESFA